MSSSSSSTLRLRGTFIHVDHADDARDVDMCRTGSQLRARTDSPPRSPVDKGAAPDVLDGQREYVAGLSERLATLWGKTNMRDNFVFDGKSAPAAIANNFGVDGMSAPAAFANNFVLDGMSASSGVAEGLGAKRLEQRATNHPASALRLQAKVVGMSCERVAAVLAPPPGGDSETRVPSSCMSRRDAESPGRRAEGFPTASDNEGSFGHPFMCSRPCLHFAAGKCTHGADCEFCHLEHLRRPVHLDKKSRELLQSMPTDKVILLMLPLLMEKMLVFDTSTESLTAFHDFAKSCGVDPSLLSDATLAHVPRSHRMLVSMCRAMSFRTLLQTLRRTALQGDAAEAQALALLAQLRSGAGRVAAVDMAKV